MISADSFISDTLNTVDSVIGTLVKSTYVNLIQGNAEIITLLFTLYIMFIGFQFINHGHHFTVSMLLRKIILMMCVYGLLMNWNLYDLFIYNIFTVEPGQIAKILVDANQTTASANIANALDEIYQSVIKAAMEFFSQVNFSFSGIAFLFYGFLVFLIGTLLCVFALLLFIYAKMVMAISLALGPIFILFLMWEPTKGMFSAWLNNLITLALIPVITSAILVLMLSVIDVTLPSINVPVTNLQFYGIAPFLSLCLATTLILSQVLRISSALGGGITLVGLAGGARIAQSTLRFSGLIPATRAASNSIQRKKYQMTQQAHGVKKNVV